MVVRKKRKRGGQKGNQNARKHGFYASSLTPAQLCEYWNIINKHGLDPELAALLVRIHYTLQRDPTNARFIREASKLLTGWFTSKYHPVKKCSLTLKKYIRATLEVKASLHEFAFGLADIKSSPLHPAHPEPV